MGDAEKYLNKAILWYEDEQVFSRSDLPELTLLTLFSIAESLGVIASVLDRVEGIGDDEEPFLRVRSATWEVRKSNRGPEQV